MVRNLSLVIVSLLMITSGCRKKDLGPASVPDNYRQELDEWKENRVQSLKKPTGWLRLAGMYWLEEGKNTFGSGENRDIRFPAGSIPENAGTFIYEDGQVTMNVAEKVTITHGGEAVSEMVLYNENDQDIPHVEHKNLEWLVIVRGDLVGIRLYNKENKKADAFSGFETFPVEEAWVRRARFIPNPDGTTMPIVNVLGQVMDEFSPGVLEFSINDEIFTLHAIDSEDDMFVIVGDLTNKTESYQAGRYIYVDFPPEESEYTAIDFNKLYNPPCSFNVFTTCQLPPPSNRLEVAITAGEKRPSEWEGLH